MSSAGDRSSCHVSNRPPLSFSSYSINDSPGLMHRSLDETRLISRQTSECYQHSTPSSSSSPPLIPVQRRRPIGNPSRMTSYSAMKRKTQRPDLARCQVHLEHVLGLTSTSNSVVSQDRSTLAYAAGSTVVLYDIHQQKQDFIINQARKAITSLALSPDGRYLATGESGHDPKVRIWDLTAVDRSVCIELGDHKFGIDCVCFSPNVDRLVSIGSVHDGNIYVWNWKEKKKLASNKCTCAIRRIAFAEDGSYFVTVGNRHVKFWYLISTASVEVMPLRGRYAILAERKDNFFMDVVCGRGDCAGMTYVITSTGLICQFDEHRQMQAEQDLQEKTSCLAISDTYLAVGCVKGAVYVFSPQTLDYLMSIPLPHHLGVDLALANSTDQMKRRPENVSFPDTVAVCLDEDHSLLTCFYNDHSFYIWDIRNRRSIRKQDSHLFHSGCGWAIETYPRLNTSNPILRHLSCMTCSSDNSIRFWSFQSSTSNLFSRQLMKIIYLDEDRSKLCDQQIPSGHLERPDRIESTPKIGGRCLRINPDGLSMAIGDRHGNIRIINMESFQQIALLEAHDSEVLSVDYSPSSLTDVTLLVSSSRDRFIHIFDVNKDYQLITTLDDHSAAITAVRFTHSQLISCSADKSLIFRSISKNENGKYQFIRSNNLVEKQTFYDLAIDHTRDLVSTACQDRMIRVYQLQDGKRLRTSKGSMHDETGYLIKIEIDRSGRYLATSCSNKCVYIWEIVTNECVATLCGHAEIVTDLKFSHDGSQLYTISGDSCIFVWNITELLIGTIASRIATLLPAKSIDLETTEVEPSICQTPSIIEEHQPHLKRQRSLWGTTEPSLPSFERQAGLRSHLPDVVNEDSRHQMIRSSSSQDDESVFERTTSSSSSVKLDDDLTFASTTDQQHSFLSENYDHENTQLNITVDLSSQQRKSVSARFRSDSRETIVPEQSSLISHRSGKSSRTQMPTSAEPRTVPPKCSTTRRMRASRTRSEDRFAGSSLSLLNPAAETSTPVQQPSYAAHTSSSMSKLRDNTVTTTPTRRTPSVVSSDTRPSSANKHMTKSLSSQNLIPPLSGIIQVTSFGSSLPRTKLPRRPPNLPIASTTSSSSSTSTSPMKTRPKGDDDDDQMPKWAQDCFYRTVVLGLKPVLLEDLPSSSTPPPMKPSTSTGSIDSSDLSEITNEIQSYSLAHHHAQVRRSVSIPDYQQVQPFKQKITIESSTTINDQRFPIVNQLADSLNKYLEELEHFYSTVSQSSDRHDCIFKQYIDEIFANLLTRLATHQQQQQQQENRTPVAVVD